MFLRKVPTRLDLLGRQPSARRPTIIAAYVLLLIIAISVSASLWEAHQRCGPHFRDVFRSSLQMRDRFTDIPLEVEFMRFIGSVERHLLSLSDSVQVLYQQTLQCRRPPSSPDSCVLGQPSGRPLVSNERMLRFFSNADRSVFYPTCFISDGIDSSLIALVPQLIISPGWDSLLAHAPTLIADTLHRRFELIGDLLSSCFDSLPFSNNGRRPDSSCVCSLGAPHSRRVQRNAHVYCALFLPMDSLPTTQVMQLKTAKADSLFRSRIQPMYPLSWTLDTVKLREMRRRTQGQIRYYDSIGTAFILYPASPTPSSFDPTQRHWFQKAIESRSVQWSLSYPDIGTGIPVVTASVAVRTPSDSLPVGVIAADFFTNQLCTLPTLGYQYLINLLVTWTLTGLLVGAVVVSSRRRFDSLIWAFASLVVYYAFKSVYWIYEDAIHVPTMFYVYLDLLLSLVSTMLIFVAGHAVFREFEHDPRNPTDTARRPREFTGAIGHLLRKLTEERPSLLTTILGALLVAFATAGFDLLLRPLYGDRSGQFFAWVDVLTSSIAVAVFGYYLSRWMEPYFKAWILYLAMAVFFVYAAWQLPYPLLQDMDWYWDILAVSKFIALWIVVATVFTWVQHDNFERLRSAGSRSAIIQRIGTPRYFITVAGILADERIIFVDRSTLQLLKWLPPPPANGSPEMYVSNEAIEEWRLSRLGDDLYESAIGMGVSELFQPGEFRGLVERLERTNPEVKIRRTLDDRETKRITSVKVQGDGRVNLRCKDGTSLLVQIVCLTAWQDWDKKPVESMSEDEETLSPWYFVFLARTVADQGFVDSDASPSSMGHCRN